MTENFDALHKWLGIAPAEQPPCAYRLLGVSRFESDPDVISNAADQRMTHLRTFATGPRAKLAENLLNQIASARIGLLNPRTKKLYDDGLRASGGKVDSSAAAAVVDDETGSLFGAYVMYERIGGGQNGPIFRAKSRADGRAVAIKVLPPALAKESQQLVKRFEREAQITSRLRNPHLVATLGAGQQNGIHFLVLEHLDGADLAEVVSKHGPLGVEQAVDYIQQAAAGLQALHAAGVYHRNIKPQNLLVDSQGTVKVANLTAALLSAAAEFDDGGEGLTKTGDMIGTVDYLAPEQASSASGIDQRADIYSLGCTLHYLLTGHVVYSGKSLMDKLVAHRANPIPSLTISRPDAPAWLDSVFQKMVAKRREDRHENMDQVIAALGGSRRAASWPRSWIACAAVAAAIVVALGAWIVWG